MAFFLAVKGGRSFNRVINKCAEERGKIRQRIREQENVFKVDIEKRERR